MPAEKVTSSRDKDPGKIKVRSLSPRDLLIVTELPGVQQRHEKRRPGAVFGANESMPKVTFLGSPFKP